MRMDPSMFTVIPTVSTCVQLFDVVDSGENDKHCVDGGKVNSSVCTIELFHFLFFPY